MIDLDRIDALANAAGVTHQPWSVAGLALLLRFGDKNDGPWNDASDDVEYLPRSHDDAALIVALVGDMPALVAELRATRAEIERLRGITTELPPRPPDGNGVPRYGLRWGGPSQPVAVPVTPRGWRTSRAVGLYDTTITYERNRRRR